jgi:hypothetical protein
LGENEVYAAMLHFHQVHHSLFQVTVFGISHTDGKIFLACQQTHAKSAPNGGRRYYRKWYDGREGRGLDENEAREACFAII